MSVRGMGEGHRSSIGFRTGTLDARGAVSIDAPGPFPAQGLVHAGVYEKEVFHGRMSAVGLDGETVASVLDPLGEHFTIEELDFRLGLLQEQRDTRRDAEVVASLLRTIAHASYGVHFDPESDLSERVLFPVMAAESHGLEDARFVQLRGDDGELELPGLVHGIRRRPHQPAAAQDPRLPTLLGLAGGGTRGGQQGPRPLPSSDRGPLRGALAPTARPTRWPSPTPWASGEMP